MAKWRKGSTNITRRYKRYTFVKINETRNTLLRIKRFRYISYNLLNKSKPFDSVLSERKSRIFSPQLVVRFFAQITRAGLFTKANNSHNCPINLAVGRLYGGADFFTGHSPL
jgi:hypothetical protein